MPSDPNVVLDVANFTMAVAGIVLAVVATILTILFYRFSQAHEVRSADALARIQENTRTLGDLISRVITHMTRRLAERPPSESPEFLLQVLQIVRPERQPFPAFDAAERVPIPIQAQVIIAVGFYAMISNLYLQSTQVADLAKPTQAERDMLQLLTVTKTDVENVVRLLGNPLYRDAIPQTGLGHWHQAILNSVPHIESEADYLRRQAPA